MEDDGVCMISCIPNNFIQKYFKTIFVTQILDVIGDALILNGKCDDGAENENASCMIPEGLFLLR